MKTFTIRCTDEQKEVIALLVQHLKLNSKEKTAEVVLRALEKLKEEKNVEV